MASYIFKLPDIGEGIAEAEIVAWHVKEGDEVREGQALADVMTDKATVEISSPVSGRVASRQGQLGAKARIGSEFVTFETEDSHWDGAPEAPPPATAPFSPPRREEVRSAPPRASGKPLAAPAVRARAKFLKIALEQVAGTGPGGRITHEDLDRLLRKSGPEAPPLVSFGVPEGGEEIEIFGLRRRIAERMQEANRRIPHFTYVEEVDVTALEDVRQGCNRSAKVHLTVLPFLISALARVIPDHPKINAHFDDVAGVIHRYREVHAGIATQTGRGLLVPVICNAQTLTLEQLAAKITELSEAARAGKSQREDLSGSTITVTSLGILGGIAATPLINPPEVAIIGVNRIAERPVAVNGEVVIRKMMNLSSSFDHRVVDGFDAAAFIRSLKQELEQPQHLLPRAA